MRSSHRSPGGSMGSRDIAATRRAFKVLERVGISREQVSLLPETSVRRMSSWAEGTKWWQVLFCAVLGVLYGLLPPLFLRESNIWLFCAMWFTFSVVAFAGFFYGLTADIEAIVRRFDAYRSYGQAGFRLIWSLQNFKPYSLSDRSPRCARPMLGVVSARRAAWTTSGVDAACSICSTNTR